MAELILLWIGFVFVILAAIDWFVTLFGDRETTYTVFYPALALGATLLLGAIATRYVASLSQL